MSKSIGNVINPDDIVHSHGADSLRLYEMFMGPLEGQKHGRRMVLTVHADSLTVFGVYLSMKMVH